jgi:hypothetical protein
VNVHLRWTTPAERQHHHVGPDPPQQTPTTEWGAQPPTPDPKPKRRGRKLLIAGAIVGGLLAFAAMNSDTTSTPTATEAEAPAGSGISKGVGSKDATADVKLGKIAQPDAIGVRYGTVHIVNHSDGISDYYIEVAILDASGTNIGWTNAVADHVKPGQKAEAKIMITEDDAASVEITEVQRTASS